MTPTETLVRSFQDLAAHVPDVLQPFVIALAATIPFVEGELGGVIGVLAGLHPVVAGVAAASGNFLSVLLVVTVGTRFRAALVARRSAGPAPAPKPSKGRARLRRLVHRFGVPGASLLGPLALPTQLTGATLVASGVSRGWVLLWQAIAIVLWTTLTTTVASGVLTVVG